MGTTDLELIRNAFHPLANKAPLLLRGKVIAMINGLTHQDVKDLYTGAGGEEGIIALANAITRVGKGETIGAP